MDMDKNIYEVINSDNLSDEQIRLRFIGNIDKQIEKLVTKIKQVQDVRDNFDDDFKRLKEKLKELKNVESITLEKPHSSFGEKFLIRVKFLSGLFGQQTRKDILIEMTKIVNFIEGETKSMRVSYDHDFGDVFVGDNEAIIWVS